MRENIAKSMIVGGRGAPCSRLGHFAVFRSREAVAMRCRSRKAGDEMFGVCSLLVAHPGGSRPCGMVVVVVVVVVLKKTPRNLAAKLSIS